ncbi:hypothetical protein LTR93_002922 [Exophiala xenobiotica]|nr:hypothetical protein LTR93_002922 [Exophiala xenobiotica]
MACALELSEILGELHDSAQKADIRDEIAKAFFGPLASLKVNDNARNLETFFNYYDDEIRGMAVNKAKFNQQLFNLPAEHHGDILKVARLLQGDLTITKANLRAKLKRELPKAAANPDDRFLNRTIDITVRLWMMLNTREESFQTCGRGKKRPCLLWPDQEPFNNFVHGLFPTSDQELTPSAARLKPQFTVANMFYICSLKVKWTESLEDHLRLDRDSRTLWVFSDEEFLHAHLRISAFDSTPTKSALPSSPSNAASTSSPNSTSNNYVAPPSTISPYPKDFLRETIRTYGILFPSWDAKTKEFLKMQYAQPTKCSWRRLDPLTMIHPQKHLQAIAAFRPQSESPVLNLRKYNYWRDRLLELYEEVYLSPPAGLQQMWRDRRNPEKYSTFIIGIMVFILAIVSTVTSIIQTGTAIDGVFPSNGGTNFTEVLSALCQNFSQSGTCTIVISRA